MASAVRPIRAATTTIHSRSAKRVAAATLARYAARSSGSCCAAAVASFPSGSPHAMVAAMANDKTVLVTGATGKQGGAIARQLLKRGYRVKAMTRKPDGEPARELAKLGATIVKGDLDDAT